MITTLELVSSGVVDLYDDIPISLNYSIADVREPEKRSAPYSKTIKIPGSKNNNLLFKSIYKVESYSNFNPKARAEVVLKQNDIPVLSGTMQLKQIVIINQKIEYEVVIVGESGGLFQAIEGKELTDLDFSEYDHVLNYSNVISTWSGTNGSGYVYPLISTGFDDGEVWPIESFQPALFVKEYVDKMFSAVGWSYTSTFFDSDFFKKLIIPYSGGKSKLDEQTISDRGFEVNNSSDITWTFTSGNQIVFDTEVSDPEDNITGGVFTVPQTGTYKFRFEVEVSYKDRLTLQVSRNGVANIYYYREFGTKNNQFYYGQTDEVSLNKGEQIWMFVAGGTPSTVSNSITLHSGSTFIGENVNTGILDGDTMYLNRTIPLNIKQKDFFVSIIKKFNLYVSQDPNQSKNLIIETRDDYYSGDTVDYTAKVDRSQPFIIKPLGDLTARRYIFRYKPDNDYYNRDYQTKYDNETYGQRQIFTDNEYLVKDKVNESIFSNTPMVGSRVFIYSGTTYRFVYPSISQRAYGTIGTSTQSANIRIMIWGGLRTAPVWAIRDSNGLNFPSVSLYVYPYAGHLDDVNNPTEDLSYGAPRQLYYDTDKYTNNNLYNAYHRKFIEEMTSKDSKVITVRLKLNTVDIANLDFRKQYKIDNNLYRLNKITDYNPVTPSTCKAEFLLIKSAATFTGSTTTSSGGVNVQL